MQQKNPRIELPKEENFRFGRVGLIAAIGFGVGLVWPHLAGVRLVPDVPSERAEAASAELSGAPSGGVRPPGSTAVAAVPAAPVAPVAPPEQPFTVAPGEVTSCRGKGGTKLDRCDPVDFDAIARGRIATLGACEATKRAHGVLSLGFELDFAKDRVAGVLSGKSTSVERDDEEALLACMRDNLGEVSLSGIRHEHERYTVFYKVEFSSGADQTKPGEPAPSEVTPASGTATVAWDAALVRAAPTRDAEVVARVLQGTRLSVNARHGDWYRVKYDTKGGQGWVFRTSIGM